MNISELLLSGAAVGLGATIFTDIIGVLRQGWLATNGFYCLVGRWIGSIPRATVLHDDIRKTQPVPHERLLGWSAHIILGILFGIGFVGVYGGTVVAAPKLWQGISFGLATVLVPWLIFQPLFGWGIAVANMPNPWKLRLKSIVTHATFGIGLWLGALVMMLGN